MDLSLQSVPTWRMPCRRLVKNHQVCESPSIIIIRTDETFRSPGIVIACALQLDRCPFFANPHLSSASSIQEGRKKRMSENRIRNRLSFRYPVPLTYLSTTKTSSELTDERHTYQHTCRKGAGNSRLCASDNNIPINIRLSRLNYHWTNNYDLESLESHYFKCTQWWALNAR